MGAERSFIDSVHRLLPKYIHKQSMTLSLNGTPDYYYDVIYPLAHDFRVHTRSDLWIEYKALESMPKDGIVGRVCPQSKRIPGRYSTLQFNWMKRRWYAGLNTVGRPPNVAGIIALPNKTAVIQTLPIEWEDGSSTFKAVPTKEVARWILDTVCSGHSFGQ